MKSINRFYLLGFIMFMNLFLLSCAPVAQDTGGGSTSSHEAATQPISSSKQVVKDQLPVRYQKPSYLIKNVDEGEGVDTDEGMKIQIGAEILTNGPTTVSEILSSIARIVGMNVSWAPDVDQYAMVYVDKIEPTDYLSNTVNNILRQVDYFYEIKGRTIIVQYKETKKYHIAMPFISSSYKMGVGGDVLGGSGASGNMKGAIEITGADATFDIWANIKENLDKVLEIWTEPVAAVATAAPTGGEADGYTGTANGGASAPAAAPAPMVRRPTGKGYYTIDRPIGLVTVTAPRSLQEKIENYFDNLKSELYRQISIEAKIVEVTMTGNDVTGINWEDLLANTSGFSFAMDFQKLNPSYPGGEGRFLTLQSKGFDMFLDAIETQGKTEILANPRLSVLNGQPALISIGENVTYIDKVTSTAEDGVITYSVTTSSVMSGLGLSVIANILDNNEIILSLTPITSELEQPIEYRTFGGANQVGLPVVNLREMNTLVRIKDGEMLVVGGLIDNSDNYSEKKVPGLGDVPVMKKLFNSGGNVTTKKELIIFLKPKIIS